MGSVMCGASVRLRNGWRTTAITYNCGWFWIMGYNYKVLRMFQTIKLYAEILWFQHFLGSNPLVVKFVASGSALRCTWQISTRSSWSLGPGIKGNKLKLPASKPWKILQLGAGCFFSLTNGSWPSPVVAVANGIPRKAHPGRPPVVYEATNCLIIRTVYRNHRSQKREKSGSAYKNDDVLAKHHGLMFFGWVQISINQKKKDLFLDCQVIQQLPKPGVTPDLMFEAPQLPDGSTWIPVNRRMRKLTFKQRHW